MCVKKGESQLKVQWKKESRDNLHLPRIAICFPAMKKAQNGTGYGDPYVFFIFDIPSAEDLRTVTHSCQESSSFPMEAEEACGASLQIITSVIKTEVAELLFGLWIL